MPRPRIELSRVTPYNLYPSLNSFNQAVSRIPTFASDAELILSLQADLASRPHPPRIVILPEHHGKHAALLVSLACLRWFSAVPGRKVMMLEKPPEQVDRLRDSDHLPAAAKAVEAGRAPFDAAREPEPLARAQLYNFCSRVAQAETHGFEYRGFDPDHAAGRNLDDREARMLGEAVVTLPTTSVIILMPGAVHGSILHEPLASRFDTWTAAVNMRTVVEGESLERKRVGYLMAPRPEPIVLRRAADSRMDRLTDESDFPALMRLVEGLGPLWPEPSDAWP